MYSDDNRDRTVNNFGLSEIFGEINNGTYRNWVNDSMSWQTTGTGTQCTNVALLSTGIFAGYAGSNIGVYKCPADTYLSPIQRAVGWTARLRSCSMNSYLGPYNPTWTSERNNFYPTYRQFLKRSSIPNSANIFVTLDEHADSINDGYFTVNADPATDTRWTDLPASYHDGACTFSFVDGHVESHKWLSRVTLLPVNYAPFQAYPFSYDAPYASLDATWVGSRASVKYSP